jgi:hypothetical protein
MAVSSPGIWGRSGGEIKIASIQRYAQSMTWNIRPGWDGGLRSLSRTALLAEQTYGFSPCTDDPDELVHSDAILERAALEEGRMELRQLDWKQVPGWLSFNEWW